MLPSTDELSRLLGTLYDAATDPQLWGEFLGQLGKNVGADSAALVMHQVGHDVHTVLRSWNLDPRGAMLYQEYYGSVDLWAQRGHASFPAGYVCTSESLCPLDEMARSEMYNDFLAPHNIEHGLFGVLEKGPSRWSTVSMYRGKTLSQFQNTDLDVLRFVAPHLRRAFRLHFQFSEIRALGTGLGTALDLMPVGIVLLGPKGEIVLTNRAAAQFISANDGLLASRNGLRAERLAESAVLERLVAEAAETSLGKGLKPAGAVSVSRSKGPPLHILITPVRNLKAESLIPVCALAFIHDPSQQVRPMPTILRDLFGLTPAECRIALLLADGRAPKEIAQMLGVAANTMKSHLSSIFGKTSTTGQVQLVRLLTQLSLKAPPVDRRSA